MRRLSWRTARSDHGAAAVEFALVSILLLVLILGMVSIAFLYQAQVSVTHAAREGARLAAVNKYDLAVLRTRAGVPDPALLGATLSTGLDPGGKWVQVRVTYPVTLGLFPSYGPGQSVNVLSRTITVESTARMRAEF